MKRKPSIIDPGWNDGTLGSVKLDVIGLSHDIDGSATWEDIKERFQRLINRYVPKGWSLSVDDVDVDSVEKYVITLKDVYSALVTLRRCYCSVNRMKICDRIFNQHYRMWLNFLSGKFNEYGKAVSK